MKYAKVLHPLVLACLFHASAAQAKMVVHTLHWNLDGRVYQGALVYDDAVQARRPCGTTQLSPYARLVGRRLW